MSPRAACRLEALGFAEVYEYVAGIADWMARNLPVEGEQAQRRTAGSLLRDDAVTCALDDRVGDVRARLEASPYGFALVTSPTGVLLGRAPRSELGDDPSARIEEVMRAGPSTVRPDMPAEPLAKRLAERGLRTAVVTTPQGRLLGIVLRGELEQAPAAQGSASTG